MHFVIDGPLFGQSAVCEPILRALPDWFGIEEAIVHYVSESEQLPTFLAGQAGATVGFLSLKEHNPYAAEIYVMGIKAEAHRQGIGRALVVAVEAYLRERGAEYLQVKTLAALHPDPYYAKTRQFYTAMGFRPLEVFTELWGNENPCLLLVKRL
jgi:ribosomal protein S18 acetylase RimI-like enzyme